MCWLACHGGALQQLVSLLKAAVCCCISPAPCAGAYLILWCRLVTLQEAQKAAHSC